MNALRTALRALGLLVALITTTVVLALASLPWWGPSLVGGELERRAAERGVTLRLVDLELSISGGARVGVVHLVRDTLRVECSDVSLHVRSWATLVHDPTRLRVHAKTCALVDERTAGASEVDEPARADEPNDLRERAERAHREAHRLVARAESWEIDALSVEHPRIRATSGGVRLRTLGEYIDIRTSVEVMLPEPASAPEMEITWRPDGSARVIPTGPLRVRGASLHVERIDVDPRGSLLLGGGTMQTGIPQIPELRFEGWEISGPRTCPTLALSGAQLRVALPLASAPAAGTPDGQRRDAGTQEGAAGQDRDPAEREGAGAQAHDPAEREGGEAADRPRTSGVDRLRSVASAVSALNERARRAREMDRPCVDIHLRDAHIDVGRTHPVRIDEFRLDRTGALQASLSFEGVGLAVTTSLDDLETVTFEAGPVEIAPLSAWLGDGTRLGGEATARGSLARTPDGRLRFEGALQLADVLFERAAVSPLPLEGMNLEGSVRFEAGPADAPSLSLHAEGAWASIPLEFGLDVTPEDADQFRMSAQVRVTEETPCRSMVRAIPAGMLPNLGHDAFRMAGSAAPALSFTYRLGDPWSFQLTAEGFPGTCAIVDAHERWDPRQLLSPTWVHHVVEGTTLPDLYTGPGTPSWTPIESVPGYVPAVMYLSEEIHFFGNPGISLTFIAKAVSRNLERGRYRSGGSTVSQQLVKNLFLTRAKSLSRKLEEVLIVWALEQWVPKGRILELYMNCIEFGPDIYGIRAAADYYFGVAPEDLTPLEAAYLAGLKPSPLAGQRYRRQGHSQLAGWWPERHRELLLRLVRYGGFITPDEVDAYAPWVVAFPTSPNYGAQGVARIPRPAWTHLLPPVRIGQLGILDPPLPADWRSAILPLHLLSWPTHSPAVEGDPAGGAEQAPNPSGLPLDTAPPDTTPLGFDPTEAAPVPSEREPAEASERPSTEDASRDDAPRESVEAPSAAPATRRGETVEGRRVTSPEEALRALRRAPTW